MSTPAIRHPWSALWIAALLCASPAGAEPPLEYQVQAAYVSKFLRFVEWPEDVGDGFAVGVVGSPDFREAMAALDGYAVGERRVDVVQPKRVGEVEGLHVLVIGPSSAAQASDFLDAARDRPVLTVSDAQDFNELGGIVQFVIVGDTMRFAINLAAAERGGLRLSSRLLRLATDVQR